MLDALILWITDSIQGIADNLVDPARLTHWSYLAISIGIVCAVIFWQSRRAENERWLAWSDLRGLLSPALWLHRSAVTDYLCVSINTFMLPVLRLASIAAGFVAGRGLYKVLMMASGGAPMSVEASGFNLALYTAFSLLLLDFGKYAGHGLMHRVPVLWEFHKVHHSAQVLTPVTTYRLHPLEHVFTSFVSGLFVGTAGAIGAFTFGELVSPMGIFGLNIGVLVFYVIGANLRHTHVWLPYPQWLSRILISPAQHQIHHSSLPQHHDRNYGSIFAIWDWLFHTLYVPAKREELRFGLSEGEDRDYQSVANLYLVPLVKAWRLIRRADLDPAARASEVKSR